MTTDKVIHYLTLASSACAALLAFDHAFNGDTNILPTTFQQAIATGLSAAIAALGAVITVLRGKGGAK